MVPMTLVLNHSSQRTLFPSLCRETEDFLIPPSKPLCRVIKLRVTSKTTKTYFVNFPPPWGLNVFPPTSQFQGLITTHQVSCQSMGVLSFCCLGWLTGCLGGWMGGGRWWNNHITDQRKESLTWLRKPETPPLSHKGTQVPSVPKFE